ncbi:MAG: hypothetical protein AAGD25_31360 [Cyanobacteria bacterium P01_F01_bin.150]
MTTFPGSPRLLKGGIVLIDPDTKGVQQVINLQYNPETLSRSFQIQSVTAEGGDRSDALRLTGPPVETISLEAEIDATDQLEFPDQNSNVARLGLYPHLAALETIIYPTSQQLIQNNRLAQQGVLEILPMQAPLTLFVWSKNRIMPMRLTEFSITEEAFDPALNPIRARVTLGMRVLSIDDLGFDHRGSSLFMSYLQQKENLAKIHKGGLFSALGIRGNQL